MLVFPKSTVIKLSYKINIIANYKKPIHPRMGFFNDLSIRDLVKNIKFSAYIHYSLFNNRSITPNFLKIFARRFG